MDTSGHQATGRGLSGESADDTSAGGGSATNKTGGGGTQTSYDRPDQEKDNQDPTAGLETHPSVRARDSDDQEERVMHGHSDAADQVNAD